MLAEQGGPEQAVTQGRRITVREAQIRTATVEIRALTINGRQVTQSVFWQLQKEDLIDLDTRALRGLPWGRVNYFRPPCKDDHLHVVWQKGDELRRACVHEDGYQATEDWLEGGSAVAIAIGRLRAWQWLRGEMESGFKDCPVPYREGGLIFTYMEYAAYMRYEGARPVYCLPEWAERGLRHEREHGRQWAVDYATRAAADEQRFLAEKYGSVDTLRREIEQEAGYLVTAKAQWAERWFELCALDQLFIAV